MQDYDEINGIQWSALIPSSPEVATKTLSQWVNADSKAMARASKKELLKAWNALAYLFPGLHPDDGLHNRDSICCSPELPWGLPDSLRKYYEQNGWPIALVGLLDELWSRYEKGEFNDEEFYCANAAKAGIMKQRELLLVD